MNNSIHHQGRWINRPESLSFIYLPPGEYPPAQNAVMYARENYNDRMIEIGREEANKLIQFMKDEGLLPQKMLREDGTLQHITERHLDIIEGMVNTE